MLLTVHITDVYCILICYVLTETIIINVTVTINRNCKSLKSTETILYVSTVTIPVRT